MPRASKIRAPAPALELEGTAASAETVTPKPVRKTRQRKIPAPALELKPAPEVPETPEPAPEVPETPVSCEGFSDKFAALARSLPPSVRLKVLLRFGAKGIDPAAELDDIQTEQVTNTLNHAIEVYGRKRDRARILAASKRAAAKAAKAADEAAADKETDKENIDPEV